MVFLSPSENTRQRSDSFAAQNNLPKFEYVLHPRTTGFTFIVDRLRKGEDVSHNTVGHTAMEISAKAQENNILVPNLLILVDPVVFFFKPQTCVSGCCQPLQHLRDSLVSV